MSKVRFLAVDEVTPDAPTLEELQQGVHLTDHIEASGFKLTREMLDVAFERGRKSFYNFSIPWRALTPAEELRFRLNSRLRGNDPGEPINWRGLR